jgi:polyribonucleotide nucleotidyltransferase
MAKVVKEFQFGTHRVTLTTGEIAKQASAAVIVDMDDTVVLATVVAKKESDPSKDFFPMTINYHEKAYAAGKIPGSFFKREMRPGELETLTARLIDRPMRPLFPKGFTNEVQVILTVLSLNKEIDPDIPAMIGTSAALSICGVPFSGPVGCARVGYTNGEYTLNPTITELESSDLDLVVAGTDSAVLMVESEANLLSEEIMLGAVMYGHEESQVVVEAIREFKAEVANPEWDWVAPEVDTTLQTLVEDACKADIITGYAVADKMDRQDILGAMRAKYADELSSEDGYSFDEVNAMIAKVEKQVVRARVLAGEKRIDGRDVSTVRPITVKTRIMPRTHGSALFTRGETQAMVYTTLGTKRDAQMIDALAGSYHEHFLFHYNFPPYCVGETGMTGSPKRREIGHGKLAKRGVQAVMPSQDIFPYTVRVVSEITESNGSSSMASVCGSSLSLMDAGVPLKAPVAGIAMGLIKEGEDFKVLTDILGDEDHLGDMDFKVAGSSEGITALQMDIKIQGITKEIMSQALEQAKEGRLFILEEMAKVISAPSIDLSDFAPRFETVKIKKEKIGSVVGKGGATIRALTEEFNVNVDIDDEGLVSIASDSKEAAEACKKRIEQLVEEVEVGKIYEGKVQKIMDFGAFVNVLPGKDGLVHISQISNERVEKVEDELREGEIIKVKVLEIDKQGRIRLSIKAINED